MIVNISFNFNPEDNAVYNIKVQPIEQDLPFNESGVNLPKQNSTSVDIKPTKKKTIKKSKSKSTTVVLEDNKLVLNEDIISLIGAEPGDRISIRFKEDKGKYYPIIAKSEVFASPESGNKLTKSLTVSYRGKQREELLLYGTVFNYEETEPDSQICWLRGEKEIEADKSVFKSNQDLEPYDEDNKSIEKDTELNLDNSEGLDNHLGLKKEVKLTYTSTLPNNKQKVDDDEVNIKDFGFDDFSEINFDDIEL